MAVIQYEPYSIVRNTIRQHQGSELVSAIQFALHYNMTPVVIVNEKDLWGEIFANWSGTGILGHLVEDTADVGFSSMDTWGVTYHYLDLSKPTVRTGVTCLVPAPKLAARWLTPLYSYSSQLWICLILVIFIEISALIIILSCYQKYFSQSSLTSAIEIVLKPIVLQPLTDSKMPVEIASILMIWLAHMLSLVITSTYSSGLASVMTLPRFENPIDTLQDLVDSNLEWGATHDVWITSIEQAKDPINLHLVKKFQAIPADELRQQSKSGKFGFAMERLPSDNFAIGSYIQRDIISKFHLMKEDIYWEYCVMMLRKSSIFLPALDLFLLRLAQAGLISKWQNSAVASSMDVYVQRFVKDYRSHYRQQSVEKLQWSHVEGAFAILIAGYTVSLIVVLLEILIRKMNQELFSRKFI